DLCVIKAGEFVGSLPQHELFQFSFNRKYIGCGVSVTPYLKLNQFSLIVSANTMTPVIPSKQVASYV
ncbi:MAG: hypothetical protein QMC80_09425, partial [Thermoplasmatales archaeon]|nr:hypothetical protein [Thermoplasmatales archaeon]